MLIPSKNRKIAAVLAFAGVLPLAVPGFPGLHLVAGHKLYLGQWRWALLYMVLAMMPVPWVANMAWMAGLFEGIWYLTQDPEEFDLNFNSDDSAVPLASSGPVTKTVRTVADITDAVRDLEQLRQEGLISEYEFEQKRRQLLDRIS
jgi:TM2 domain-containing membrane protein YozV